MVHIGRTIELVTKQLCFTHFGSTCAVTTYFLEAIFIHMPPNELSMSIMRDPLLVFSYHKWVINIGLLVNISFCGKLNLSFLWILKQFRYLKNEQNFIFSNDIFCLSFSNYNIHSFCKKTLFKWFSNSGGITKVLYLLQGILVVAVV